MRLDNFVYPPIRYIAPAKISLAKSLLYNGALKKP